MKHYVITLLLLTAMVSATAAPTGGSPAVGGSVNNSQPAPSRPTPSIPPGLNQMPPNNPNYGQQPPVSPQPNSPAPNNPDLTPRQRKLHRRDQLRRYCAPAQSAHQPSARRHTAAAASSEPSVPPAAHHDEPPARSPPHRLHQPRPGLYKPCAGIYKSRPRIH